jgi:hypothetical protein
MNKMMLFFSVILNAFVIGRNRNFPGYHINTERTTVYEKEDYPLRPHKDLGYNSFHYNHILPTASMLLDYLVTDAFVRSEGAINFPSEFIEGYAYLQTKFYGHKSGEMYGRKASLWMPEDSDMLNLAPKKSYEVIVWIDNEKQKNLTMEYDKLDIVVSENGVTVYPDPASGQLPEFSCDNGCTIHYRKVRLQNPESLHATIMSGRIFCGSQKGLYF